MKHKHVQQGNILPLEQQSPIFDNEVWYRCPESGKLITLCHCNRRTQHCKWCDPVQIYERLNPGKKHPDNLSPINETDEYRLMQMFERSRGADNAEPTKDNQSEGSDE